ncbi:hypothetical protein BC792_1259 [Sphingobacterium allocomposti]|uniref:Uncharacterized protein n=1 Tax=Sphingobacterium allocomposti TaxID=415956 RepID=A0A5S5D284_9SPHI|nr:hypothetical protein BC792_1259 [Sphingobacterium composti Yoo et al. 2007 non Ten et al. 2007]
MIRFCHKRVTVYASDIHPDLFLLTDNTVLPEISRVISKISVTL